MRESEDKSRYGGNLRGVGGLMPNIHSASYHVIYHMSISI